MSELRWTLLILGVVFLAVLSWWERRRPRQAFAPRLRETAQHHPHVELTHTDAQRTGSIGEPWIGDTELSDAVLSDVALSTDAPEAQDRAGDSGMSAHYEPAGLGPLEELPTLVIPDDDERLAMKAAWDAAPPEPTLIDPDASGTVETLPPDEPMEASPPLEASRAEAPPAREPAPSREPAASREPAPPAAAAGLQDEIAGAEGVGAVRVVESPVPGGDGAAHIEPIVDWPPDESRRIVALRLVAPQPERFPGRVLRLALAAEGFLLGKYSIYHKPDDDNRAVLSAASLTRPGAFDLTTMDSQRYAGVSLFAVLPGPKTPPQAFEELLATARNLNERLQGALQDERGGPLTPLRVASIRESLRAEAAGVAAAAANES